MGVELKHTEIGDIPVEWDVQTFHETFHVLSNNTLSRAELNNRGGTVKNIHYGDILVKYSEVLDCENEDIPYITDVSMLSSSTMLLQDGDIVIADTAEDDAVGKVIEISGLGDGKLVAGLHTIPCRVKKGEFASGWLGYYMNSPIFHKQILPYITGIKVSSISKTALESTLIIIPPINEQRAIISVLRDIDRLIFSSVDTISKMNKLMNAAINALIPLEGDSKPQVDITSGNKGWELKSVDDLVDERIIEVPLDGNHGEKHPKTSEYVDVGIPFIMAKDIKQGEVDLLNCNYISKETASKLDKGFAKNGDVLLTHKATIGEVALLENLSTEFAVLTPQVTYYRVIDNSKLCNSFLATTFNSHYFQKKLKEASSQSTRAYIGITEQRKLEMFIPIDIDVQKDIATVISDMEIVIRNYKKKLNKYRGIKQSVIDKLLTGKTRLA